MRGTCCLRIGTAGLTALLLAASPAAADYPGSTQPGAQQVPPGNLVILRAVPPRNAIIPGAGQAVTAPTAPPSVAFAGLQGIASPLSDAQAASVTGSVPLGQAGGQASAAIDGALRSQSLFGGASADRSGPAGAGATISGAVQSGMGAIRGALGALGGAGH